MQATDINLCQQLATNVATITVKDDRKALFAHISQKVLNFPSGMLSMAVGNALRRINCVVSENGGHIEWCRLPHRVKCGKSSSEKGGRVKNGEAVKPLNKYPWVVS
ncbi:hypothetical protein TNCV_1714761 [Trichonephila clavipes]|nr:hypothetical protein TNCV_1714761 [Trichonephila clavipes]